MSRDSAGVMGMNGRAVCLPTRAITTPTKVPAKGCAVVPLDIPCAPDRPVEVDLTELEGVPTFPLPCWVGEMPVTTEVRSVVLIPVDIWYSS